MYGPDIPEQDPRFAEAAQRGQELNERMYYDYRTQDMPWIRSVANEVLDISRGNAARSQALADYQLEAMRRNDARYWNTAVPFEDRLLQDVNRFDAQAYKEGMVRQALADTQAQFSNAQAQQQRSSARMGINPNSGRAMALGNQTAIAQAAAMASAANKTRQAAEQIGLSTKMQMYGGMRGLAGLGATNAQLGLGAMGAGQSAAAGMTGATGSYAAANNAALDTFNRGNAAQIGAYNSLYNSQVNAASEAGEKYAMLLGAATQLGAAALSRMSDRRLKENIRAVGQDERTGLTLYEFSYKGSNRRFVGVMADEVEARYPEAVLEMPGGYKAVNYAALGLEMVEVEETAWASHAVF